MWLFNPNNYEVLVFLQNMDACEIYQANGKMAWDITAVDYINDTPECNVYPNPARKDINYVLNQKFCVFKFSIITARWSMKAMKIRANQALMQRILKAAFTLFRFKLKMRC
jgi:hypothetical protein